jgi:hypothetical protein
MAGKSISLLAKWMPSINASGKARQQAKRFAKHFGLTYADYRKLLPVCQDVRRKRIERRIKISVENR